MLKGYRNATVWTNAYCCKKYHTSGDHAAGRTSPPVEDLFIKNAPDFTLPGASGVGAINP